MQGGQSVEMCYERALICPACVPAWLLGPRLRSGVDRHPDAGWRAPRNWCNQGERVAKRAAVLEGSGPGT
jgi:hypothetical protein